MSSNSVSHIFQILFQIRDVDIFAFCAVFVTAYIQPRTPFLTKKISGEI